MCALQHVHLSNEMYNVVPCNMDKYSVSLLSLYNLPIPRVLDQWHILVQCSFMSLVPHIANGDGVKTGAATQTFKHSIIELAESCADINGCQFN